MLLLGSMSLVVRVERKATKDLRSWRRWIQRSLENDEFGGVYLSNCECASVYQSLNVVPVCAKQTIHHLVLTFHRSGQLAEQNSIPGSEILK